jgi:hypothetical protein
LVYLVWPGYMMLGIAMRQKLKLPAEIVRASVALRAHWAKRRAAAAAAAAAARPQQPSPA